MSYYDPNGQYSREDVAEDTSLLGKVGTWRLRLPRASPVWLIPVIFLYNLSRGMATSPKVEVFTWLACRQLLPDEFPRDSNDMRSGTPEICLSDPGVQKATANLQAKVNTLFAILCTFTAGRWGRFGDEHGRKAVLAFTTVGALFTDFLFLLASKTRDPTYGSKLLVATPFIEGTLGGMATYFACTHAYVSDCTSHSSRATTFAFLQGILYLGLALGPEVAGVTLRFLPSSSVSTIFVINIIFFLANLVFIIFILPESVPWDRRLPGSGSCTTQCDASPTNLGSEEGNLIVGRSKSKWGMISLVRSAVDGLIKFFSPLSLFLPSRSSSGGSTRDWNLTIFVMALIMYEFSMGLFSVKYLYAKHMFGWDAEQLGYYISYIWIVRAVYLLILLPMVMRKIKSYLSSHTLSGSNLNPNVDLSLDITLSAVQFSSDVLANTLVLLGPSHSPVSFVGFMTISVICSGAIPVMNSVGASLLVLREHEGGGRNDGEGRVGEHGHERCRDERGSGKSGQLYGAISVIASVTHAIQPYMFSSLYGATVATFPKAIFLLASFLVASCVALLMLLLSRAGVQKTVKHPGEIPTLLAVDEAESI